MTLTHAGLITDIIGAALIGMDAWIKTRGIGPDSIAIGYGEVGGFWKISGILGYALLFLGFVLQYFGS